MKILVFDNYDSFTYNLVHIIEKIVSTKVDVFRNNEIELEKISAYDKIILSPGPGVPSEAGLLLQVIKKYAPSKSILGVCLGHQAIAEAFGGKLVNLKTVYHGVANKLIFENVDCTLFSNLKTGISVGRYHSWIVDDENFPNELQVTARDENGYIMALQHKYYDVQGVQFHPESILTPEGETIIKNWIYK
ncbi:MAG: aminodeoxychorismate/anthranilate synthase component II [Ferruginibacter sp.]|nr:aminodeoxychorismate/anthranilate synthase component II [Ferruginibacter sp.]